MTGAPKNVALFSVAKFSILSLEIVRELKSRTGCTVYLYVVGEEGVRKYKPLKESGLLADVIDYSEDFDREIEARDLDQNKVFAEARNMERFIGRLYNEVIMARRDIGMGFAFGGSRHPRSPRSEKSSYVQVVHSLNAWLGFFRREFESKHIDLVLNGQKEVSVVARAMNIAQRIIVGSRNKNYHYWAEDEFGTLSKLQERFDELYDPQLPQVSLNESYLQDVKWRAHMFRSAWPYRFLQDAYGQLKRQLYLTYKGYKLQNRYYFSEIIAHLWRRQRALSEVAVPNASSLVSLRGRDFLFYPLHTEPELSIQGRSPEYFNQLAAIGSIARDLPAGALVAVKETLMAVGRRPRDFYRQIKDLKNAVFLDATERGLDVIQACRAVATITGTAGFEAAVQGKPVIAFGRHNIYNFLPHVNVVLREEALRPAIEWALDPNFDSRRAAIDGANFLRALVSFSFDLGSFEALKPDGFDNAIVKNATDSLIQSLSGYGTAPVHAGVMPKDQPVAAAH